MEVGWGGIGVRDGGGQVVVDECCGGKLDGGIDEADVKKRSRSVKLKRRR